jgi:hypothetical protein
MGGLRIEIRSLRRRRSRGSLASGNGSGVDHPRGQRGNASDEEDRERQEAMYEAIVGHPIHLYLPYACELSSVGLAGAIASHSIVLKAFCGCRRSWDALRELSVCVSLAWADKLLPNQKTRTKRPEV